MTQPLAPPSKRRRRRSSGVPLYGNALNGTSPFPAQQETADYRSASTTQTQANGQHGCLSVLEIANTATWGSQQEALQGQLDAVDALYRVYKVEHYAALEEMRLAHQQLRAQGKNAVKPLLPQPPCYGPAPASAANGEGSRQQTDITAAGQHNMTHKTIRSMLSEKRPAGAGRTAADQPATITTAVPIPTTQAPPPTAPPMPSSPPTQQILTHAKSDNLSGSPPGVSLNIWMAPTAAASSNTPQSLRHHGHAHATGVTSTLATATAQHDSLGRSRMGPGASVTGPAATVAPAAASGAASEPGFPSNAPAAKEGGRTQGGDATGPAEEGSGNHVGLHDGPTLQGGGPGCSTARVTSAAGLAGPRGWSYGDEALGYGSDAEPAAYTDVEDEVLAAAGQPDAVGAERLTQWRARWAANCREVLELESLASCSTQNDLDASGALASLSGRAGRFLICRTTVLIGRGSDTKGGVDVDLAREAAAAGPSPAVQGERLASCAVRVSRRQAFLALRPDGSWWLENVGRRQLHVDGSVVAQFSGVVLRHLAMLEVGGLQLLFMVNEAAVERVLRRTARIVA